MILLVPVLLPALIMGATPPSDHGLAIAAAPTDGSHFAATARRRPAIRGSAGRSAAARVEDANRAALHEPRREGFVDAVQVYPWSEGGIYQLYTAPGHITDIALQPGEVLTSVAAGDTVRWIVGDTTSGSGASRQVHVLLKPTASGLSTNLVITTDRRIYRLAAVAGTRAAMAAVSWTYPTDGLLLRSGRQGEAGIGEAQPEQQPVPFDFGYVLKGDKPSWRPLRVFNDGRQVFIEFPPGFSRIEAPPLFARGASGSPELLNYRVRGRFYIVDRLFDAAELRMGAAKQQVVRIERRTERAR